MFALLSYLRSGLHREQAIRNASGKQRSFGGIHWPELSKMLEVGRQRGVDSRELLKTGEKVANDMLRGRGKEKLGAVPKAMAEWHDFWSGSEAARATIGSQSSVIFSFKCQVVVAEGWVEGCNTGAGQEEISGWTASVRLHKLPLGR